MAYQIGKDGRQLLSPLQGLWIEMGEAPSGEVAPSLRTLSSVWRDEHAVPWPWSPDKVRVSQRLPDIPEPIGAHALQIDLRLRHTPGARENLGEPRARSPRTVARAPRPLSPRLASCSTDMFSPRRRALRAERFLPRAVFGPVLACALARFACRFRSLVMTPPGSALPP